MVDRGTVINSVTLSPAKLSFGVAIIPTTPLKDQLAAASLAISQRFTNNNIIDNQRFPAHLSLYLGGTDREFIGLLSERLQAVVTQILSVELVAEKLHCGTRGFIGVQCAHNELLLSLVQRVIGICGELHRQYPRYRPHLIDRWPQLTKEKRELLRQYGTYKTPAYFDPHLSVAEVSEQHVEEACQIARDRIFLPQRFAAESVQLVDIGHRNEQWVILHQWAASN